MDDSELLIFAICILALSFLAGVMEITKGLPLKKKLLCWITYVLLAAVPAFFLLQVWPSEIGNIITIYDSSDEENSLVGFFSSIVFFVSVVAIGWSGRQLGKVLRTKIFHGDLT